MQTAAARYFIDFLNRLGIGSPLPKYKFEIRNGDFIGYIRIGAAGSEGKPKDRPSGERRRRARLPAPLFALQHRYDVLFGDRLALLDADLFDHAIPIGSRRRYTADQ